MGEKKKTEFWNAFSAKHRLSSKRIPLFRVKNRVVALNDQGKLACSDPMEELMGSVLRQIREDRAEKFAGLVYVMYALEGRRPAPLYIGIAEARGQGDALSRNITAPGFFGRWGYSRYYHMGDLSHAVIHGSGRPKYERWADELFESRRPPTLRRDVYFWCGPISERDLEQAETASLKQYERKLITSAAYANPQLLNVHGRNGAPRRQPRQA